MDVSQRAWNGWPHAVAFYWEQQRLWIQLLVRYLHDEAMAEDIPQSFQGAVLAYLISGEREAGRRMLDCLCTQLEAGGKAARPKRRPANARVP